MDKENWWRFYYYWHKHNDKEALCQDEENLALYLSKIARDNQLQCLYKKIVRTGEYKVYFSIRNDENKVFNLEDKINYETMIPTSIVTEVDLAHEPPS